MTDSRERAQNRAITREMIDAGCAVLDAGRDAYPEKMMVSEIYKAMRRLERDEQ